MVGSGFQITRPLKSWKFIARSESREPVSAVEVRGKPFRTPGEPTWAGLSFVRLTFTP